MKYFLILATTTIIAVGSISCARQRVASKQGFHVASHECGDDSFIVQVLSGSVDKTLSPCNCPDERMQPEVGPQMSSLLWLFKYDKCEVSAEIFMKGIRCQTCTVDGLVAVDARVAHLGLMEKYVSRIGRSPVAELLTRVVLIASKNNGGALTLLHEILEKDGGEYGLPIGIQILRSMVSESGKISPFRKIILVRKELFRECGLDLSKEEKEMIIQHAKKNMSDDKEYLGAIEKVLSP